MNPDKKKTIKGHIVERFYWVGKDVVYIDNILTRESFCDITVENIESIFKKTRLKHPGE